MQKTKRINITVQKLCNQVQNQIHVPTNQSSQVPYIIFLQSMKLSSYKYRFFHKLPPAHRNNLRQPFLTEISCMMKKCSKLLRL